ncbi:glycosyltransferase [Cryobacterium adonitolivorans]|uniref:Glycosyltransferase n=1 Tax=Cryobacterium adonitolivorans TaxID=1259189 RepID=A0A4R8WDZ0_9MICO|nr:glycosyltransferase family 4 protein [Cryobacterium adonitolivorans]TFC05568.1 glycosyltransferase [Cryobacterium adonitolivorans]
MSAGTQRVLHYYARYLEHPSGVTDSLNHWAEASIAAGDDVSILAAQPTGGDRNEFAFEGVVKTIPHWGRSRGTWVPIGLLRELKRGDILVLHEGWVLSNVVAGAIARIRGARIVVMPHGVYEQQIVANQRDLLGIRARMDRWLLGRASAVHVFYGGEKTVVREFAPSVTRFITVPNGTTEVPADAMWNGAGDYFLWIGRFDLFHKGIDNLLEFWARLPQPRPKLRLVGPDFQNGRAAALAMVDRLGLGDSVDIGGRVTGAAKDELLASCLAYVHPSRWESCSIMLLEAAAAGVPSLISDSIHAAHELGPLRVLRSVDFTDDTVDGQATLESVAGNRELAGSAFDWAATEARWSRVGTQMVEAHTALGLRTQGGLRP